MTSSNEDQRNDPVLREGVKRLMAKRVEECEEVADLLQRASKIMLDWHGDPIMDKDSYPGVLSERGALYGVQERAQWLAKFLADTTETYVGNIAAFLTPEQAAEMWGAVWA